MDKSNSSQDGQNIQGSQTNVAGDIYGSVFSGQFLGTFNYYPQSSKPRIPLQKPLRPQYFIGREKEIEKILRDLQPGRIITLCGPGGIGKTALASEVVWRLAPDNGQPRSFPDGIIFHTFYRQPSSALALEAIALAYGENPEPSPIDAARRALSGRKALLILDGAEGADNLEAVLTIAGSCGVLITTRRRDNAPDDFCDLLPLQPDDAIELLQLWGRKYAEDDVAAGQICVLLGGLPLAMYLVGRYLIHHRQLAADYLVWLKSTPLDALDMGERQHKSIPLLMECGLVRISELAKAALGIAGVLSIEPFDSHLIEIALGIDLTEANRCLGELVDYGLLQRTTERYLVTHALIHTYAKEKIVPNRESLTRLAYVLAVYAKAQTELGLTGIAHLDSNRAHILALQSACLKASQWEAARRITWGIKDYLRLQGHWIERITIAKAGLLAARSDRAVYEEAAILNILGNTYVDLGNPRQGIKCFKKALEIARKIGYKSEEGAALGNLGLTFYYLGKISLAIGFHGRSLSVAREIGNYQGEVAALNNIGLSYSKLGEFNKAIEYYNQVLGIACKNKNRQGEAYALGSIGIAYMGLRDARKVLDYHEKALKILREIGDRQGEGSALGNIGVAFRCLGDFQTAIKFHRQHLAIAREIGDRRGEGNALWNISITLAKIGDKAQAISYAESALEIFKHIESPNAEKAYRMLVKWQGGDSY